MIAVNWDAIGGDAINLQDFFSADDLAKMQAGTIATKTSSDQIMVWDAANDRYTTYFLRKQNNGTILGWADLSSNTVISSIPVVKGSSFWFIRQGAEDVDVVLKGEVSADVSVPFAIKGNASVSGYNMVGAGFPVDLMLNETKFAWDCGLAGTIATKTSSDQIMIWNAASDSYTTTYYLRKQNNGTVLGWADLSSNTVDANAKIPVGAAAWYIHQGADDIEVVEASPLAD